MVSLRSGKRTARVSSGGAEPPVQTPPAEQSTPRRSTRGRKAAAPKVFEDIIPRPAKDSSTSSVEEVADIAVENNRSPDVFESDSDEVVPDSTEGVHGGDSPEEEHNEDVADVEKEEVIEVPKETAVVTKESVVEEEDGEEDDEEKDDDDDDMPMEITSKKEAPAAETGPLDSDDDDDEPMEITSKVVPEVPQKSVVEQLLEKKANKAAKLAERKLKKRSKKKESKKIDEGFYQVKMKKSNAKFNVVTLKSGVQKMLEPEVNFREQLLQSRTAGSRVANSKSFEHRAQWVSKRL